MERMSVAMEATWLYGTHLLSMALLVAHSKARDNRARGCDLFIDSLLTGMTNGWADAALLIGVSFGTWGFLHWKEKDPKKANADDRAAGLRNFIIGLIIFLVGLIAFIWTIVNA